jgi:HlyD family secretion protein
LKKLLSLVVLILLGALVWWAFQYRNRPPGVPFAKVVRETLVSTLPTNGKVEPMEWAPVRAEAEGLVGAVPAQEGQSAGKGAVLATLTQGTLAADVAEAQSRVTLARSELATITAGGKTSELAEIENSIAKARFNRDVAQRDFASLRRLEEKHAAAPVEVEAAQQKIQEADLEIRALERRRAALIGKNDRTVAEARLHDAEAALNAARAKVAETVIRAPLAGTVYGIAVRPGAYVNTGDLIANVGRTDELRVRVYVDEPELGRVQVGQPVVITWDALPGKKWQGTVERKPTEIQALGTRQVGEVLATIANSGRELLPGTNVNAEIRTSVVDNALTIPKEAMRRTGGDVGVYVLRGNTLAWQKVATGASSITRVQVVQGLSDGDSIALPTDVPLKAGIKVRPVYP